MQILQYILVFSFFCFFSIRADANSIIISGIAPSIPIKRSLSGNWESSLTSSLEIESTEAALQKITVSVAIANLPQWQGRFLNLTLGDQASWRAISPMAVFTDDLALVNNGSSTGTHDLARNIATGVHPPATLVFSGRANSNAIHGSSLLTVTYTLVLQ